MAEESSKRRQRRSFTDEFKAGAVRLVLDEGKTIPQVARDLDLTESSVRNRVERARADRGKGKPGVLTTAEKEELATLRKEVRQLSRQPRIPPPRRSRPGPWRSGGPRAPGCRQRPRRAAAESRRSWAGRRRRRRGTGTPRPIRSAATRQPPGSRSWPATHD